MIKAIFLDYTGTILQQRGPDLDEIISHVTNESTIHTREEVIDWWHKAIRRLKSQCYGDAYRPYDRLLPDLSELAKMEIRFKKGEKVEDLVKNYWMYAPVYDDVREFFDLCPLPVYVLCEVGRDYAAVCLRRNDLHVNGIISSDEMKAYAPHSEFYAQGLKNAECAADETIYVSEDYDDCVTGANQAGMNGVLLDRRSVHRDVQGKRIRSLIELLPMIQMQNQ